METSTKPIVVDLFCGAGGASMGYYRAGFDVVGVDLYPQKNYPFEFHQDDALHFLYKHGGEFDLIHASPPCQAYSVTKALANTIVDLVYDTRLLLINSNRPYVIENVLGAPLRCPILICGTMFPNLRVIRHRLFETNVNIEACPGVCNHWGVCTNRNKDGQKIHQSFEYSDFITVVGHAYKVADGKKAMNIDWMTGKELSQAIPPEYTEWLGKQIIYQIRG